jgi:dipeptidase
MLQIVKGKHWFAVRVPDDEIAVVTNRYTIGIIDFTQTENYRASASLVKYAIKRNWYKPTPEGQFHFANAYANPAVFTDEDINLRQWRAVSLLAKKKFKPDALLPFSFKPRKRVKVADLFRVLRDHYEDTKYDLSNDYKEGSPNKTEKRTICAESTRYSFVAHLRSDLPREIGNLVWVALRRPDSNAYSPWYFSISSIPDGYSVSEPETAYKTHLNPPASTFRVNDKLAYWNYSKLSNLVDKDYRSRIRMVRKEWNNFENYIFKTMGKKEKEFDYFLQKNKPLALKLITNFVHYLEYRKWFLASELIAQLVKQPIDKD